MPFPATPGRDVEDPILYPHDGVGETEIGVALCSRFSSSPGIAVTSVVITIGQATARRVD